MSGSRSLASALCLAATAAFALPEGFNYKLLADGLNLVSTEVLPDGRVLVVEKHGKITLINQQTGAKSVALDHEEKTWSLYEAGMTQVLADPDFLVNGYLYVQYCKKNAAADGDHDWVSRFTMKGNVIDPASEHKILDLGHRGPDYHHGSGLAVSPKDGMLYIGSGSRGGGGNNATGAGYAANKARVEGKIHRVRIPSGEIPSDNPLYGQNTGDARAVYYYGLRNPFTMHFHPVTGVLRFSDIAPGAADDRVNEGLAAGTNYGYHNSNGGVYGGGASPLWTAGGTGGGGGGMVGSLWYTGANFPAKYKDAYFVGQVRGWNGNLKVFFGKDGGQRENFGPFNLPGGSASDYNPIDIKMDAAGAIYVSTRFQTEQRTSYGGPNGWWTKGRVIKVWHGEKEPALPGTSVEMLERAVIGKRLAWKSPPGGGLSVEALRPGPQTIELRTLDGRAVATIPLAEKAGVRLASGRRGLHVLTWRSGGLKASVKVML